MGHKKRIQHTKAEEAQGKKVFMAIAIASIAIAMLIIIGFSLI